MELTRAHQVTKSSVPVRAARGPVQDRDAGQLGAVVHAEAVLFGDWNS
jgi:hypothetical protein